MSLDVVNPIDARMRPFQISHPQRMRFFFSFFKIFDLIVSSLIYCMVVKCQIPKVTWGLLQSEH